MNLIDFSMMRILTGPVAKQLLEDMAQVTGPQGQIIGTWDATTCFLVKVLVRPGGEPDQWWIAGPMTRDEARQHLLGDAAPSRAH